jgi:acyl-CoA synthetase (NDP forming)
VTARPRAGLSLYRGFRQKKKVTSDREKIETFFNPKSVAIVGASRTIGKWGFTFLRHLIQGGFKGKIYPVNPSGGEFQGVRAFRGIREIPDPVDLAFILLPPEKVKSAIEDCGRIGVPACVVITAGFRELGRAGKELEDQIAETARAAGIALVGPNCAGIASPEPMSLYCMMMPTFPPPGKIAIVSQSGNLAGSIQRMLWKQDVGVSRVVSTGNQSLLSAEDFFDYLATDDETEVIVAYLEGITEGRRFMDSARRITRRKPLLIVKGGCSNIGVKAAKSHTGAIAGSHRVFAGMCRQYGVTLVDDVEDLIDTAVAFTSQPLPAGNRVGITSNGGGWGVLAADSCNESGLEVVTLPEKTLQALDKYLPAWWNRSNPVDLVAGMSRGAFFKSIEALAKCDVVDGVIVLGFGYAQSTTTVVNSLSEERHPGVGKWIADALHSDERGMNFILDVIGKYQKPVILSSEFVVGADIDKNEAVLELRRRNLLIYPSTRRAAKVLARLHAYRRYRDNLRD